MGEKADVRQGTLALMILKTLEALGPPHGYGVARRVEQTSGRLLSIDYGTPHPGGRAAATFARFFAPAEES